MKAIFKNLILLSVAVFLLFSSCRNEKPFKMSPPYEKLIPSFIEITVNPCVDSVYIFENGTKMQISTGSLLDEYRKPIKDKLIMHFRQFDDAASIFLAGIPMSFGSERALATAGMFELRCSYNGKSVLVDPQKPLKITIGSNFADTRQGFFKMDDKTGSWELIDIPEWKLNTSIDSLKKKIKSLRPEFFLPLGPNFYVFDYTRMADIFIGEDNYEKIYNANLKAMAAKMEKYGVKSLELSMRYPRIKYKGNMYDISEMLWKAENKIKIPNWIKLMDLYYYDEKSKTYVDCVTEKSIGNNQHEIEFFNHKSNQRFILRMEVVCHLRYLLRFSPEQLYAKQQNIEKEIEETERKIRQAKLIEYAVEIFSMGVFNCDRPVLYSPGKPQLAFTIDGVQIGEDEVKKVAVFNENLTSVSYPVHYKPVVCPFFKGTNRLLLITEDGKTGLLTGVGFDNFVNDDKLLQEKLVLELKSVNVDDEATLRLLLRN